MSMARAYPAALHVLHQLQQRPRRRILFGVMMDLPGPRAVLRLDPQAAARPLAPAAKTRSRRSKSSDSRPSPISFRSDRRAEPRPYAPAIRWCPPPPAPPAWPAFRHCREPPPAVDELHRDIRAPARLRRSRYVQRSLHREPVFRRKLLNQPAHFSVADDREFRSNTVGSRIREKFPVQRFYRGASDPRQPPPR